jgi:hypothetical protein
MSLPAVAIRRARARHAAIFAEGRGQVSLISRVAPHGGLNTRDSFGSLPQNDARVMDNVFPEPGAVGVRKGFTLHGTGVGSGDVKTIAEFNDGANSRMVAFSDTAAFNATTAGAASSLKTGLTSSGRWDWVNMNGEIAFVDGVNVPQKWNGSTWANLTISGSGLTVADITGIQVFKERSFVWEKDSQDFWYSAVLALGGTMTIFALSKLGSVASKGGKIVAIEPWTVDGGAGQDDFFTVIMSTGQVVIYSGTDPSDATKWALVGVYDMGRPMSRDGFVKHGGDLTGLLGGDYKRITAETLRTGELPTNQTKMSGLAAGAVRDYSDNDGFQAILSGDKLIFNVPVAADQFEQHVQNIATQAWCRFQGLNARSWGEFGGDLYFGDGLGNVMKAFSGNSDAGNAINWEVRTAWDALDTPKLKRMTGVRPFVTSEGSIGFNSGLAYDFADVFTPGEDAVSQSAGAEWDVASWDTAEWAPDISAQKDMLGASGQGFTVSHRMRGATTDQEVKWYRTDYLFIPGGLV